VGDDETKEKRAETHVGQPPSAVHRAKLAKLFPQLPAKKRSTRDEPKYGTKNESVRTRLESSDARRTALPRSLLKNHSTF